MITKFSNATKMMRSLANRGQVVLLQQRATKRLLSTAVKHASSSSSSSQEQQQQWSEGLRFASPETDFTAVHVSANSATMESEWSQELTFAAPESDFTAAKAAQQQQQQQKGFAMRDAFGNEIVTVVQSVSANSATAESEWAQEVMIKDAKKDVKRLEAAMKANDQQQQQQQLDKAERDLMMNHLQYCSPDSALGFVHVAELLTEREQQQLKHKLNARIKNGRDMPECLPLETTSSLEQKEPSFVERMMTFMHLLAPESATGTAHVAEVMSDTEKEDYKAMLRAQQEEAEAHWSLPQSMQQALEDDERAIVVTSTRPPFQVVNVNEVWEGLCGYTRTEAQDKPIGSLLKGPDTESDRTRRIMARLVQEPGEEFDIPNIINYTKAGRKFVNRLHVGTMVDQETGQHYFVGILQDQSKAKQMEA